MRSKRILNVLWALILSFGMLFQTITARADSTTGVTTNWENDTLTISYASSEYPYAKNKLMIMLGTGPGEFTRIDASDSDFSRFFPDSADASGTAEIAIPLKDGNISALELAYKPYGSLSRDKDTVVDVVYIGGDTPTSLDNFSFRPFPDESPSEGKDVPPVGFEAALSGRDATIYISRNGDADQIEYVSAAKSTEHKLGLTVKQGNATQEITDFSFGEFDTDRGAEVLRFSLPNSFTADSSFTAVLGVYGYKSASVSYNPGGDSPDEELTPPVGLDAESFIVDGQNKIVLNIYYRGDKPEDVAFIEALANGYKIGLQQGDTRFDLITSGEIGSDPSAGTKTVTVDAPAGFNMSSEFNGGFTVNGYKPLPFEGSPTSGLKVSPTSLDFGTLEEEYDASAIQAKQVSFVNSGSESITVQLQLHNSNVFVISEESLTILAGETKTLHVGVAANQPKGTYDSEIDVKDGNQTLKTISLSVQIGTSSISDACRIDPDNSQNTTKFIVTCTDSTISDFDNEDGFNFEFFNDTDYVGQDVEISVIDSNTMEITQESIIDNSIYLNGTYNVKLDVFKRVSGNHENHYLTAEGPITCNTTGIVHDERGNVNVTADENGIHLYGMSEDYVDQAILKAVGPDGLAGRNNSYLDMDRGLSPHNTKYSVSHGVGDGVFIQKEYDMDGKVIGGLIPTAVLVNESIEAGGYQRMVFHVPGYTEILLETQNPNENVIEIVNGAPNLGNFVLTQNLTQDDPNAFSIILSLPDGDSPEQRAEKWAALKTLKEFKWSSSASALSSWGFNTDEIIWNEESFTATIPFQTANSFYGMMDRPGMNYFDVFTIVMQGYAPSNVVGTDGDVARIVNPLEDAPARLRTFILGTKIRIECSSARYLETFDQLTFSLKENEYTEHVDFSIKRGMQPYQWSPVTKDGTIYYIEFTINEDQLNDLTSSPDAEFIVNISNPYFRSVWSSMRENFNAVHYVAQSKEIAETENPDPEDLAAIDEATLDTQFKHVDFVGGVTNNADNTVNVNGTIAGAVTEEDTDLYHNEIIEINTSITEMPEEDKKEIMDYLNGHHLGEIKHAVDIKVIKTYPGQEPQVLSVLGVNTAIVFSDLPELKEGYEYIVITKHNGMVKLIPVTYKNGQLIAYTNEFSSFAITSRPKDETPDKPDPTPDKEDSVDPSADPSVKPSGPSRKSESKKTSPIHIDNVVTCQMAGYPAGYAWNEAAKACQPGFIDDAGVFHGTSVRRAGVPNTYDRGLESLTKTFVSTLLISFIAAYFLRKY